jgi:hypothetical protein
LQISHAEPAVLSRRAGRPAVKSVRADAQLALAAEPSYPEDEEHSAAGSDDEQQPMLKSAAIDRWVPPMGMGALGGALDAPEMPGDAGGYAVVQLDLGRLGKAGGLPKPGPPSEGEGSEGGQSAGGHSKQCTSSECACSVRHPDTMC